MAEDKEDEVVLQVFGGQLELEEEGGGGPHRVILRDAARVLYRLRSRLITEYRVGRHCS